MTKKYRTVAGNYSVRILCTDSNNIAYPVVFEYYYGPDRSGRDVWLVGRTSAIGTDSCDIEEIPEEPIKVGYSWTKDGSLYKVVHEAPTGKAYLVVTERKDQTQNLASARVNQWYTDYWWKESDIRQASET